MEETVVTFRNESRSIAVYITHDVTTDELEYNVEVSPKIEKNDTPDLPILLWGLFMDALTNNTSDKKTPIEK